MDIDNYDKHEVAADCRHAKKRQECLGKSARSHQRIYNPRQRPQDRRTDGTVTQQPLCDHLDRQGLQRAEAETDSIRRPESRHGEDRISDVGYSVVKSR